jgi:nicotinamidase-related amidase
MRALVIVDIQNDYFPGGRCELVGPEAAAANAARLLEAQRAAGLPVFHIQHVWEGVDATVRAAVDLGFGCTVAHDACATLDLEFGGATIPAAGVHGAFMAALGDGYANVVSSDDV